MKINMNFFGSCFVSLWVFATYLFLYIPIIVLVVFSFNKASLSCHWGGFSLQWYYELFASSEIWDAVCNSMIVAISSVFLSLVLGTLFVILNAHYCNANLLVLFYPNLFIPEIVIAVGLLSFFVFFNIPLGLNTLIVGHTLIGLGYAVPIISSRFNAIDLRLIEASLDLGASYRQTFFKIIVPLLMPALLASGLLIFILSLDDFLIAFFCNGTSSQTLSLYIFSMLRSGISPVVNALATIMLMMSSVLVFIFCSLRFKARIW